MTRILHTPEADECLRSIGRHIAEQSQSLDTAMRFLDKIEETCMLYATQPLMGSCERT
jgi:plasmid stabilization system protein ParE